MSTFWDPLRGRTPARIGLDRVGDAAATRHVLESAEALALARDAVHGALDVDALAGDLRGLGLGEPVHVPSAAPDRATYLSRPDLGRRPAAEPRDLPAADLAVIVADGLSAEATARHATGVLTALLPELRSAGDDAVIGPPVIATQARVAIGDHIGAAQQATLALVLIGERPGLSAHDSLGAYLTWAPAPGVADSARNCVSNIRPPHGLDHAAAARTLARLITGARRIEATGIRLKDTTGLLEE
ncbi:ethanolamine ammonia-lyase [Saccharomonospora sp. CUA-673]|uniref:ethanolamine ammonia-lyase subunit EutC n=1 Tax=Saccharomonospora sp. CUA-673 TaxID=1904969 RepID=UPI00095E0ED7|nr:ethanolamine ammonia-lyase subunit EutC [Saccharomonospora sp. CUA-673]OLT47031.1 ethanolamine ammonia-lyase [Saccharomonospora sp. CUA-673]